MSQKRIDYKEGLIALGVAADRVGGKLSESVNGYHRNIELGEVSIRVELRDWNGPVSDSKPRGIEAAFFDLGCIYQEGHIDSRKFSKRVAVNKDGVLPVNKLVDAIEKCIVAQRQHDRLAEARADRAARERLRKEQAEEKLAASAHFSQHPVWPDDPNSPTQTVCDAKDVVTFYTHGDGGVTLRLHRLSPERAIEIIEAISKS